MRKAILLALGLSLVAGHAHAQFKGPAPVTNLPSTVFARGGGATPRPPGPAPIARSRAELSKISNAPHGPIGKPGGLPPNTPLFSYMLGQAPSRMGGLSAGFHAKGFVAGDTDIHLEMPARGTSGFDEVVQAWTSPPSGNSIVFECMVTPNHRYSTMLDAYYFGATPSGDHDEVLANTTALNTSGTVTVVYDPVSPAPDVVFVALWSDAGFTFTGCKAKTGA